MLKNIEDLKTDTSANKILSNRYISLNKLSYKKDIFFTNVTKKSKKSYIHIMSSIIKNNKNKFMNINLSHITKTNNSAIKPKKDVSKVNTSSHTLKQNKLIINDKIKTKFIQLNSNKNDIIKAILNYSKGKITKSKNKCNITFTKNKSYLFNRSNSNNKINLKNNNYYFKTILNNYVKRNNDKIEISNTNFNNYLTSINTKNIVIKVLLESYNLLKNNKVIDNYVTVSNSAYYKLPTLSPYSKDNSSVIFKFTRKNNSIIKDKYSIKNSYFKEESKKGTTILK